MNDNENTQNRKVECSTSDFEEESEDNVVEFSQKQQSSDLGDILGVKDDELSDDSGTVDDKEWKGSSIPPDIIASANHYKVIREEPRKNLSKLDGEIKMNATVFRTPCDEDITDFRRHQVEAYTNLEDLLDEPWEESDFAPPSKVDVVLRVGWELGERYSNV